MDSQSDEQIKTWKALIAISDRAFALATMIEDVMSVANEVESYISQAVGAIRAVEKEFETNSVVKASIDATVKASLLIDDALNVSSSTAIKANAVLETMKSYYAAAVEVYKAYEKVVNAAELANAALKAFKNLVMETKLAVAALLVDATTPNLVSIAKKLEDAKSSALIAYNVNYILLLSINDAAFDADDVVKTSLNAANEFCRLDASFGADANLGSDDKISFDDGNSSNDVIGADDELVADDDIGVDNEIGADDAQDAVEISAYVVGDNALSDNVFGADDVSNEALDVECYNGFSSEELPSLEDGEWVMMNK